MNLESELLKVVQGAIKRANKTSGYDTPATVTRIEDDVAWVHIDGGVDETPVRRTIDAKEGDVVQVRVAGGKAWLTGNASRPPTDDTTAIYSIEKSERAVVIANDAVESAETASVAAVSAVQSANLANQSANSALTQLSVVEDVVGVLEWISEHATYKASADTEVIAGKMYFTKSGNVYTPVASPTGNPSTSGYYEIDSIDEAVSNYVASHLALTNAGLWVVNDNISYKILLASDGMKVYDSSGNLVSTFGESIEFSSARAQYIGGSNAYIVFNPVDGSMTMGGSHLNISGNITMGGQTRPLTQVLTGMQSEIDDTAWYLEVVTDSVNYTTNLATLRAKVYQYGAEVNTGFTLQWYKNGTAISGQTSAVLSNVSADALYTCVAS